MIGKSMTDRIFVAGHKGMVGSAILRHLSETDAEVITVDRIDVDLRDPQSVNRFFLNAKIDQVYLAAAIVGGIHANNTYPATFIYENLMIQANVVNAAHKADVQKLLNLGSSCIYPKNAPQPIPEGALLNGALEETNEPYAVAKIAGIKLCESYNRQWGRDYRSVMPSNLYGPNDNFHVEDSHVIPALIRRLHDAVKAGDDTVKIWGSGTPKREFLHVDDMARASIHVMNLCPDILATQTQPMLSHINVGTGVDCSIKELAQTIADVTGFKGDLNFDLTRPDGAPRKLLDVSRLRSMGWVSKINLREGLAGTYEWFLAHQGNIRG